MFVFKPFFEKSFGYSEDQYQKSVAGLVRQIEAIAWEDGSYVNACVVALTGSKSCICFESTKYEFVA